MQRVISHTGIIFLFMTQLEGEREVIVTTTTSSHGLSTQQKSMDNIVEEYRDIFTSTTRVPLYFQVKHSIDVILDAPLPNGPIYR
jgi:hypothetical protein